MRDIRTKCEASCRDINAVGDHPELMKRRTSVIIKILCVCYFNQDGNQNGYLRDGIYHHRTRGIQPRSTMNIPSFK